MPHPGAACQAARLPENGSLSNPETTTLHPFRLLRPGTTGASQQEGLRLAYWTLAFALVAGGILRSVWIEDMEWKDDERWSYQMSQEVGRTRPWPAVGMPTSLKFPNPGLSMWIFVPIGRLVSTPTAMARAIVLLNMVALIGFALAVRAYLPREEREPWLWGLALQAVSPFAIRMSRKIWPPSLLTPFLLLLWVSHRHRDVRWGAIAWGLVGALIGQVHLSGWFVATGLALGTVVAERLGKLPRSHCWRWWILGTVLGLASAIPWLRALPGAALSGPAVQTGILQRVLAYLYGLFGAAFSVLPFGFLGLGDDTVEFEVGPLIGGIPTHVPELLRLLIILAIAARTVKFLLNSLAAPVVQWVSRKLRHRAGRPPAGPASALATPARVDRQYTYTGFYVWSTIAIPAVIFVCTTDVYFYHYFYVFCPFLFVLVATCFLPWRRLLLGLVITQAVLSVLFLGFVHQKGGAIRGEYRLSDARPVSTLAADQPK